MATKPLPELESVNIPTLPEVVMKLGNMLQDPKVGLKEIGAAVRQDAAMAAKLLRIANSAVSGLKEKVVSVEQAASALGARTVRNLAMQASVMEMFEELPSTPDLDIQLVWKHAILTANQAQALAVHVPDRGGLAPDDYYSCGLVHDLGKLVLLHNMGQPYLDILRQARDSGRPAHAVEEHVLGYNHMEMGAKVAEHWGLPQALARAIQFHHGPLAEIKSDRSVAIVAVADQVAYRIQSGNALGALTDVYPKAQALLGIPLEHFGQVVRQGAELWPAIEL